VAADALDDGLDKPVKPAIFSAVFPLHVDAHAEFWCGAVPTHSPFWHSIRRLDPFSVNPDSKPMAAWDDLETWIKHEPEWARGRLGFDPLWSIFRAGAGVGGCWPVQRGSYSVVQRTNELAIRMALGARKKDVLRIVLASVGVSVGSGLFGVWHSVLA